MEQIKDRILKLEQIEWRKLKDLQPPDLKHVSNSEHIRQSIQKNGFAFPFAVWQDNTGDIYAIDGHTRKNVLQEMDNVPETLPAFFIAANDREDAIRILLEVYNQRHNEINPDVLTEWLEVEAIAVETVNLSSLDTAETKQAKTEVTEDEYDDTPPEHPETILGDLYEIGKHRLLCGSSTEVDTWANLMNGTMGDLVVTDPPYNVAYTGKTKDALTIENDRQSDPVFYQFLYDFYTACGAYMKKGASWYVWHADSEGANFRSAMADAGIMVKQCLIWVKNSMVLGRQDYQWQHEPCLYGWKEGAAHNWYSDRKQTTVLHFDRPQRNGEHPTMKPVALIAYQVKNSSKEGDVACDGFGGSGTTMVACEQLSRACYMIELDPKYCDVIVKRMIKLNPTLTIKRNGEDVTEFWKEKAAQS